MADEIGLVLSGGGARGAYEIGVLSELLPWLERGYGQRPNVIVGTSVGALNSAYIAAKAGEEMEQLVADGAGLWREIRYRDVLAPLLSLGELSQLARLTASFLSAGVAPYALLDPAPLTATLGRLIMFEDIHRNVADPTVDLRACAVVATAAHSNRTVVFHDGGAIVPSDERRGIDYVPTEISEDHIRASAAIPVAFPAVEVRRPEAAAGWYFDGGTRLNTPIKPALELGAERVIVVGLNSLSPARKSPVRPDLFDGSTQIIQGLLVDPATHDVQTLATINEVLLHGGQSSGDNPPRVVPYIFIAPSTPNAIGQIARDLYRDRYAGVHGLWRSRDLSLLGRFVGASKSATRGELFSYLFFAGDFATALIELGRADARRWIDDAHDDGAWQLRPLGAEPGPRLDGLLTDVNTVPRRGRIAAARTHLTDRAGESKSSRKPGPTRSGPEGARSHLGLTNAAAGLLFRISVLIFAPGAAVGGVISDRLESLDLANAFPDHWPAPTEAEETSPRGTSFTESLHRATAWAVTLAKADMPQQTRLAHRGVITTYGIARIHGRSRLAVIRYLPHAVRPSRDQIWPVEIGSQSFPVVLRPSRGSGQGPLSIHAGSCWVTFETADGLRRGLLTAAHAIRPEDATPGEMVEVEAGRDEPSGRLYAIDHSLDAAVVDVDSGKGTTASWPVSPFLGLKPVRLLSTRGPIETDVLEFTAPGATILGVPGRGAIAPVHLYLGKRLQRGDSGCLGLDLEPTFFGAEPAPYLIYLGRANLRMGGDMGYGILLEQVTRIWSLAVSHATTQAQERKS
jgi:NTE family protein